MDIREAIMKATGEPTIWKPEPGDFIVGRVLSIRDVDTEMGKSRLAEIEDEDDLVVKTVFLSSMLRDRFMEYGVEPGDRVAIKYHGKKQGSKREYHHYTVFVEKAKKAETALDIGPEPGFEDEDIPEPDEETPF